MGKDKHTICPFCGAKEKYMVGAADWVDENLGIDKLSDISRKNLEKSLQLEANNAPFYRDAMLKSKNIEIQGIFKYLSKIEAEHASVIKKILKCEMPEPEKGREVATDDERENIKAAHEREKAATAFYSKAATEAFEPRIKRVFTALAEIETDHIKLEGGLLDRR
jgi:rubrerythrin